MAEDLAAKFEASKGEPITFDGCTVLPFVKLPMEVDTDVMLNWRSTESPRIQGINIQMRNGTMEINDQALTKAILWEDTCPTSITFVCRPKRSGILMIYNAWRYKDISNSWLGNYGIVLTELSPNSHRFECSDGPGPPDFRNLVFDITLSEHVPD